MSQRNMSQRQLASLLGIDPSNLSKVLSGKLPFSTGLINRLVADLGISKQWLVAGEGLPYEKESLPRALEPQSPTPAEGRGAGVPVYDIDVTAGCRSLEELFGSSRPVGALNLPGLPPDTYIIKVSGDSMTPVIMNGGYIAIRRIHDTSTLFWGRIYVVELDEYRMVKFMRRNADPSLVTLHSQNPAYEDLDVPRDAIRRLYIVEGVINYQAL